MESTLGLQAQQDLRRVQQQSEEYYHSSLELVRHNLMRSAGLNRDSSTGLLSQSNWRSMMAGGPVPLSPPYSERNWDKPDAKFRRKLLLFEQN
eukprot:4138195-Amphidinium_carterae.1